MLAILVPLWHDDAGARKIFQPKRKYDLLAGVRFASEQPISTHKRTVGKWIEWNGIELEMQMGKTENHLTERQTVLSIRSIQVVAEIMIIRIYLVEVEWGKRFIISRTFIYCLTNGFSNWKLLYWMSDPVAAANVDNDDDNEMAINLLK